MLFRNHIKRLQLHITLEADPSLRGSLLFTWSEKDSSEHFQEAGETPTLNAEKHLSWFSQTLHILILEIKQINLNCHNLS